jgi:hypothetical protein
MTEELNPPPNDHFLDFEEEIAAHARQFFRATRAKDSKAVEVCLFYFRGFLRNVLGAHLKKDPHWGSNEWWLDGLGESPPETTRRGSLKLRDLMTVVSRDQHEWYDEPFEFELELCPVSGAFRQYTFRFADHRPLAEKQILAPSAKVSVVGPGDNGWVFVFRRQRPEAQTKQP